MKNKTLYIIVSLFFFVIAGTCHSLASANLPASSNDSNREFGESSLTVGTMAMYFNYDDVTWFNDLGYMAMIGTPSSNIFIGYGETEDLLNQSSSSTFRANLQLGGDAYLWRSFLHLPLGIYIPIRFNAGYQNLSLSLHESDQQMSGIGDRDDKHFANFNFGAGVGASVKVPFIPLIASQISLDAFFVRSPGVMIRFIEDDSLPTQDGPENEVGVSITNDVMLQASAHQFLQSTIGVTAGVRFSGMNWAKKTSGFGDVVNALLGDEIPENSMEYTALYIGINW